MVAGENRARNRRRAAAGLIGSAILHVAAASWLLRSDSFVPSPAAENVEIDLTSPPPAPSPPPEPAPEPEAAPDPSRQPRRRARPPTGASDRRAAPSATASEPDGVATPAPDAHPLMRMRGGPPDLMPGADTIARALGPMEAPPPDERPSPRPRRKPRVPGTGLTTITPEPDLNVQKGAVHPRYFQVLATSESVFRPDRNKVADEVRGDLGASTSIKRWLFGGLAGDPEALRNSVPHLACLVCVTLRPSARPEIEVAGASGAAWFDREASESIERALRNETPDEDLEPGRACYHFATKVWRTRPDITNLAIPFKLQSRTTVRLLSYEKVGS